MPRVIELSSSTDPAFDRLWTMTLLGDALQALERESPDSAEAIRFSYREKRSLREGGIPAAVLRKARGRLGDLFAAGLRETVASRRDLVAEAGALLESCPGHDPDFALARELLLEIGKTGRPRLASVLGVAASGLVILALAWAALSRPRRIEPPAPASPVHAEPRAEREAELEIERAAAFLYHGLDAVEREARLDEVVRRLRNVKPGSPHIARALRLKLGAAADPARFGEAASAGSAAEGAAVAWDHSVYRWIRERVWGEPAGAASTPDGAAERLEADRALLVDGDDRKAFELYGALQQRRRGDPVVWLAGAAAALRAGQFREALAAAEQSVRLLDLGQETPLEGAACAHALCGLCLEKMGQGEGALRRFERAVALRPANPFVRALLLRTPEPALPPPRAEVVLSFSAPRNADMSSVEKTLERIRSRFARAGLPAEGLAWKGAERKVDVRLGDADPTLLQKAEWLVTRRGVFSVRALAPREINDKWVPLDAPPGHEWAPLNLSYPAPSSGRWRLLRNDPLPLSADPFKIAAEEGRVTWTCSDAERLTPGSAVALLLDGEIIWYGTVAESRGGSLTVKEDAPQRLIPVIFGDGPLPVQFERE